ncbi:MAG TPA: hypothetical protein VGK73_09995 [Polyangiaceae bacterium]
MRSKARDNGLLRREFLSASGAAALAALTGTEEAAAQGAPPPWNAGQLAHLIPAANHERFLIKASFKAPLSAVPRLTVDGKPIDGIRTDARGRFWRFDVTSLKPATTYQLRITDPGGNALCDAWPLKTFPGPDTGPEQLRILAYSCAGGYDGATLGGKSFFLNMAARQRLLARGLSYQPDVVIANGDHVYWDMETSRNKPYAKFIQDRYWKKFGAPLDLSVPMLHPKNASTFLGICDYQIASLYGTALRSTPAFFLTDDHDMFENGEFDARVATLPPDSYGPLAAEQTHRLYYPEFLPDRNRPSFLPGGDRAGAPPGSNDSFGTLRFGALLEAVLYDCRRFADYKGAHAKLLPRWVEDWIVARTRAEDTQHFFHVPSLAFGYTTGKLGEWYPDFFDEQTGKLVVHKEKPGWQRGWFAQHQRLLEALAAQSKRSPVVIEGDVHATASARIVRSGELALQRPVNLVLAGALGTGDLGFASARGGNTKASQLLALEEGLRPAEKNGFTIIDVTPKKLTFRQFTWRPPQGLAEIDTMQPAFGYDVVR